MEWIELDRVTGAGGGGPGSASVRTPPPGKVIPSKDKARAFYRLVIKMCGPVWPFINVVESEYRHARAFESL